MGKSALEKLSEKVKLLAADVQKLSKNQQVNEEKIQTLIEENKRLTRAVFGAQNCSLQFSKTIHHLESELNVLRQEKLSNNLILNNIPVLEGEDLKSAVGVVAAALSVNIDASDFSAKRLKSNSKTKCPSVLVQFKRHHHKLEISQKLKNVEGQLEITKDKKYFKFNQHTNTQRNKRLHGFDHLTQFNYKLLNSARDLHKCGIKYIWSSSGKIFIQASDNDEKFNIRHLEDIEDIKQKLIAAGATSDSKISVSTK